MILHLVRHARYALAGHALGGRTDHPLDAAGRVQAHALGRALAGTGATALRSSPRPRAVETAVAIAAATGLPVRVDDDLDEIDFGAWTGRPLGLLEGDPAWTAWNGRRSRARPPGGESTAELLARMTGWLDRIRPEGGTVVAVGHGDPIRTLACHLLGLPLDRIHGLELPPAGRAVLALDGGAARLLALHPPPEER